MKVTDFKNEDAIEIWADILEPSVEIFGDEKIKEGLRTKGSKMKTISYALKTYKKEVVAILAALERKPVDEYECSFVTLPIKILEALNDPELQTFFSSVVGTDFEMFSGSATENTEDEGADS